MSSLVVVGTVAALPYSLTLHELVGEAQKGVHFDRSHTSEPPSSIAFEIIFPSRAKSS